MKPDSTRRKFLAGGAAAGVIAVAGCAEEETDAETGNGDDDPDPEAEEGGEEGEGEEKEEDAQETEPSQYEVWALDQGLDNIHFYEPGEGDAEFDHTDTLDLNELEGVPDEGVIPHMIDYSSDYEYAAVACTGGARTLVIRTEDHELVGNIETGPSSHMAAFAPGDDRIHVDVIAEDKIARIETDLENETFEYEAGNDAYNLHLAEDETVQEAGLESVSPICHQFDGSGRSIHTLGPSYHDAGLVIVDHDEFAVEKAFTQEELPTNCGTMPHPEEGKFYLTAGLPESDESEGIGEYYVYDTEADEVVEQGDTGGVDAHGFWYTPDGEELWVLNRGSDDGVIIDPETDEVVEKIDDYGPKPDIMWASPDGEYMFVTLRGPDPQSAAHAAEGEIPGFNVLDIESREIVTTVEPDPIDDYSEKDDTPTPDFHGIGVRPIDDFETEIPTSPPF